MDGTTGYYAKLNKSIRERLLYDLTYLWNSRNKAEDQRGREEEMKQDETREGDKPLRLLIIGNKLRIAGGEGAGGMG